MKTTNKMAAMVADIIASYFQVSPDALFSSRRGKKIGIVRKIYQSALWDTCGYSHSEIAQIVGRSSAQAPGTAIRSAKAMLAIDDEMQTKYRRACDDIRRAQGELDASYDAQLSALTDLFSTSGTPTALAAYIHRKWSWEKIGALMGLMGGEK